MNDYQPMQSLYKLTAGVFAAAGLCTALLIGGKKMAERIQQQDFARWSYVTTNEIPALLQQNSIAQARLSLDEVKGEIESYKAGKLQAGFHVPQQQLRELEARLDWKGLTNAYLTNVSPETQLFELLKRGR